MIIQYLYLVQSEKIQKHIGIEAFSITDKSMILYVINANIYR